ncbi:MAG: AraC family transcriptional regulator [Spirochaetota bacterium]
MRRSSELFGSLMSGLSLTVLEHGFFTGDVCWNFKGIRSPFSRLYCTIGGDGAVIRGGTRTRLRPRRAYLIPLNTANDYTCTTGVEKFFIHFRLEAFPGRDVFDGVETVIETPFYDTELTALQEAVGTQRLSAIVNAKGVIFSILSRLIPPSGGVSPLIKVRDKYRVLFSAIDRADFMAVKLSAVAEDMGLSHAALSRNFKRDTGMTLTAYLAAKAIDRAREELLLTDKKVREIAAGLGLGDEFYFSRFFKKYTKLSPAEYRERNAMR